MKGVTLALVAIASPGDVQDERDEVERAIYEWNQDRSEETGVVFLSLRWERDATPVYGKGSAQQIINQEVISKSDALIGLFGTRLGKPTAKYVSGTVEELEEALKRGIYPHVLESTCDLPRDFDRQQFEDLQKFLRTIEPRNLLGRFGSLEELNQKTRRILESEAKRLLRESEHDWIGGPGFALRFERVESNKGQALGLTIRNVGAKTPAVVKVLSLQSGGLNLSCASLGVALSVGESPIRLTLTRRMPGHEAIVIDFTVAVSEAVWVCDRILL